jgi:hypothetical protein
MALKRTTYILVFAMVLPVVAIADPPDDESPFQKRLEQNVPYHSRESHVIINGVDYQKIEIENKTYYVTFKGRDQEIPYLLCDRPAGWQSESLVEGSVQVMERKLIFVQALRESCYTQNNQQRNMVKLDPLVGFHLPSGKDDAIKDKKIGINPLDPRKLQFQGSF